MKINLGNDQDQAPRVEMIPLIDIIFCILTFFLLSGMQMARQQQSINVDIPAANKTAETQTRDILVVSLDPTGQAFIEQQPVTQLDVLQQQIKSYRITKPNGSIVLYASKQVKYDRVIQILDLMREAGGNENVALGVDNDPTPSPTVAPLNPPVNPLTPAPTSQPGPAVTAIPSPFNVAPTAPIPSTAPTMAPFSPSPAALPASPVRR
jgi:biopolymer transport protein ExbD